MRTWRNLLFLTLASCTPMKSSLTMDGGSAAEIGASSNANGTFELLSDNTLRVWQDKSIQFQPAAGATGTYAVSGLPSWASFNATTGTVTGSLRTAAQAGGQFTITRTAASVTTSYGPYKVAIVGDALAEQQWHVVNRGQKSYAFDAGTGGEDMNLEATIGESLLGTGIRIAVSDSGTVISHPDLAPNNLAGENRNYLKTYNGDWLGDPTPSASAPELAHGTAVAGLAAAKGWNGIGGRGIAPEAKFAAILYVQAQHNLVDQGYADAGLLDQFAGNFDVFNYSWGDPQCALTSQPASFYAKLKNGVETLRGGKGAVYVVAGGNEFVSDVTTCYPSASSSAYSFGNVNFSGAQSTPYLISVGAVNADGRSSSYSSPGSSLWVSAPGGEYGYSRRVTGASYASKPALVTTDYPGCANGLKSLSAADNGFDAGGSPNTDCRYTATMNGTSGASPNAAGAVALILQANPNLSWRDVKYILAKTADKIDPTAAMANHPDSALNLTGHTYELPWVTNQAGFHFHNWYGFGRINVDNAVALARSPSYVPLGTFAETPWVSSGTLSLAVPDGSATGASDARTVSTALTTEAVQVQVSVSGCVSDVGIELESPLGTKSILMNINSLLRETSMTNHLFLSNAFLGEAANGAWTLKVIDGKTGCVPQLTNWQIKVFGH